MKLNLLLYALLAAAPVFAQDKTVSKIAEVNKENQKPGSVGSPIAF
ncbi:hypothetical protein [Mucilaginibacter sp. FT3.2]|nr:hypothetical protein [Mucilaginibacter sp. FT3.2]MBB6231920.1 hypothetical protein [Mucilaginibacter sp. FT3.2]